MRDVGEMLRIHPGLARCGVLVEAVAAVVRILHIEVARQVAVVVGTRVLRVIPVERRVAVVPEAVEHRQRALEGVGREEVVFQECNRFVRVAHARIAQLAVLVAPVGVVHVVPHQVVDLLRGGVLGAAAARRAEGRQGEPARAPLLGHGGEIRERTVVLSRHPVVAAQAGGSGEGVGPAAVQHAGTVGEHQAEAVAGAVGHHAPAQAGAHVGRVSEDVGHAVDAAQAIVGHVGAGHGVLGARGLIEAAPQGERRAARHGVVHQDAGEVDPLRLGGIAAHVEAHGAEIVAGEAVEYVVLVEEHRRVVVVARIAHVELLDHLLVEDLGTRLAQRDVEQVADVAVRDRHVDPRLHIAGRGDHQVVRAVRQAVDADAALGVGRGRGHLLGAAVQDRGSSRDGRAVGAAEDHAGHAADRLREQGEREQQGKECRYQSLVTHFFAGLVLTTIYVG